MSFISDSDANLELNLRNMLGKSQKKVEDSLPMPNNEKEDGLVVGNSLNSDLDLDSLINEHFSDIKQHYSEQSDSLVIDNSFVLDGSIVNPISGLTYGSDDELEVGQNIDVENSSNIFSDIITENKSSINTNISDKGISLEGGLAFDKNGNVNSWDVDLGIDYANPDSGTALLKDEDIADLHEQSDQKTDKEDSKIQDRIDYEQDSILELEELQSVLYSPPKIKQVYQPQYSEPPIWVVFLIIFTSGVMLISGLTALDLLVAQGCDKPNCHTPLIVSFLRYCGYSI